MFTPNRISNRVALAVTQLKVTMGITIVLLLTACGGGSKVTGTTEPPPPPPAPPSIASFSSNVTITTVSAKVTLNWQSKNADACNGSWSNASLPANGSAEASSPTSGIVNFTLTCTGKLGQDVAAVAVKFVDPVKAFLKASADTVVLGQSVTLTHSCENASSASNSWTPARISASMSGDEVVTPSVVGTVKYVLTCNGEISSATAEVTIAVIPASVITGKLFNLKQNSACLTDSRVYVKSGYQIDSSDVKSDGSFTVNASWISLEDSVDVVVDAKDTTHRSCFPTLIPLMRKDFSKSVDMVRIPRSWTIEHGMYAGQAVSISLDLAYTPAGPGDASFFHRNLNSATNTWQYSIGTISSNSRPIAIGFDRNASNEPIDSIGFFRNIVDSLEKVRGIHFFTSGNFSSFSGNSGITVVVNNNFVRAATAGPKGYPDIVGGILNFQHTLFMTQEGNGHELYHIMGFGHTCSWRTNMASGCDLAKIGMSMNKATDTDVGYMELFEAVSEKLRSTHAKFSLAESHQGERVLMLGLPREVVGYQ